MIKVRIKAAAVASLDRIAAERGLTRSEAIRQAILAWIDPPTHLVPPSPTVPSADPSYGVPHTAAPHLVTGPLSPPVQSTELRQARPVPKPSQRNK